MRATALGIAMAIVAVLAIVAVFAVGGLLERPLLSSATVVSSGDGDQLADPDPRAADLRSESRAPGPIAPDRAAAADSLRDTAVDGAATLDALGRPRADRELRRLFDYFLARSGERSPETIRSALALHLHAQLAPPALATVLAWYDAYVALERDSVALAQAAGGAEAGFARVRALRRERLGEELAQAFYAQEEADYELARQRGAARGALLAQQGLDARARADGLAELDRSAAAEPVLQASAQLSDALAQNQRFEREGTDAATRYAQREAQYGAAAAQRLADLDQRRAQWQLRLRSYAAQRQRVLADGGLSETQRRQRLDALLADFDPNERRRVDALARNGGLPGR
ncbi:lipase secretion chaperone [Lysobacter enzymogenes]|uniref:lipase secretion chaperone n=1 Tax=Lysobacter enzymogenes TaxID=69 RepID=UPI001AF52A27|nr:lipase secretion chaperone [Lysobacter enzymogenes]QQQ00167.1 hypothetical protein JHW41_18990 [Lysobacter enzymogenes]